MTERTATAVVRYWLERCTDERRPLDLIYRRRWLLHDGPGRIPHHAVEMVRATVRRDYPARDVAAAVRLAVTSAGGSDADTLRVLSAALRAVRRG